MQSTQLDQQQRQVQDTSNQGQQNIDDFFKQLTDFVNDLLDKKPNIEDDGEFWVSQLFDLAGSLGGAAIFGAIGNTARGAGYNLFNTSKVDPVSHDIEKSIENLEGTQKRSEKNIEDEARKAQKDPQYYETAMKKMGFNVANDINNQKIFNDTMFKDIVSKQEFQNEGIDHASVNNDYKKFSENFEQKSNQAERQKQIQDIIDGKYKQDRPSNDKNIKLYNQKRDDYVQERIDKIMENNKKYEQKMETGMQEFEDKIDKLRNETINQKEDEIRRQHAGFYNGEEPSKDKNGIPQTFDDLIATGEKKGNKHVENYYKDMQNYKDGEYKDQMDKLLNDQKEFEDRVNKERTESNKKYKEEIGNYKSSDRRIYNAVKKFLNVGIQQNAPAEKSQQFFDKYNDYARDPNNQTKKDDLNNFVEQNFKDEMKNMQKTINESVPQPKFREKFQNIFDPKTKKQFTDYHEMQQTVPNDKELDDEISRVQQSIRDQVSNIRFNRQRYIQEAQKMKEEFKKQEQGLFNRFNNAPIDRFIKSLEGDLDIQ